MASTEKFRWEFLWTEGTDSPEWSHSGIALTRDGGVVFASPAGGELVMVDPETGVATTLATSLLEIHGISPDTTPDEAWWLADPGEKARPRLDYGAERRAGRTLRMTADGRETLELIQPELDAYSEQPWRPTSTAADDDDGVWVADGYGASLVHKFDRDGNLILTLNGSESGLPFTSPHGIVVDRRRTPPQLVVADRGNQRLVVYNLDGSFDHVVVHELLSLPSSLAQRGDDLVVTELNGGLLAVGADDSVRSLVFPLAEQVEENPWPNALVNGRLERPTLSSDRLNSPHGVAVGADGSIYLTEWVIGGRQIRLRPLR